MSFGSICIAKVATVAQRSCDRTAPSGVNGDQSNLFQCNPMHRDVPATHLDLRYSDSKAVPGDSRLEASVTKLPN